MALEDYDGFSGACRDIRVGKAEDSSSYNGYICCCVVWHYFSLPLI
jgi:hypothetical protein